MDLEHLGKNPIPGEKLAGTDARETAEFETMAAEIEKLSSLTADSGPDWSKVLTLSAEILAKQSKDLLAASYCSAALMKTAGLRGLAQGFRILRELSETYWDGLFPQRMRARRNALEWLLDRVPADPAEIAPGDWSRAESEAFIGDIDSLDRFLSENMDDAPMLISLSRGISAVPYIDATPAPVQEAAPPPPEKPAAAAPSVPTVSPAARTAPPSAASPLADPGDLSALEADDFFRQVESVLRKISVELARRDPFHPDVFRLGRIAARIGISVAPPAQNGKTLIPAPEEQIVSALESLSRSGAWKDLLEAAESRISQYLFWLDLDRYAAQALEGLGCRSATEAIRSDSALYVRRLPEVAGLSFENGMPFANQQTREWLRQSRDGAGDRPQGETAGAENVMAGATARIEAIFKDKDPITGLGEACRELQMCASRRERFATEIALCRKLLATGREKVARPYLSEILCDIDEHNLEQWEPSLAVEGMATVLSGLKSQDGEKETEAADKLLNRILLCDPVRGSEFI